MFLAFSGFYTNYLRVAETPHKLNVYGHVGFYLGRNGGRTRIGVKCLGKRIWFKIRSRGRGRQMKEWVKVLTLKRGALKLMFQMPSLGAGPFVKDALAIFLSVQKDVYKQ